MNLDESLDETSRRGKISINKLLIVVVAIAGVLLIVIYLLLSFTNLLSSVPLIGNLAKKNMEGYHAVFLSNNQVYFGKLRNEGSQYAVLEDVYYLRQTANLGDENQAGQLDLVKRGRELHGPENIMKINRDHILFIENVRVDSAVGQAIQRAKQLSPAQLQQQIPKESTPQATAPGSKNANRERSIRINDSDVGFLRVSSEPNTASTEVARVTSGKSFKVLDEKEGWYQIEYETGKTGWVSGRFVTVE
jgi:hypothetical protein